MEPNDSREVISAAVHQAAMAEIATAAPHWVGMVLTTSRDVVLAPDATTSQEEPVGQRLDAGRPLTPLADPAIGDRLGDYAAAPSTVGDLLAVRGANGERVISRLERQCAVEAARLAPMVADELVRDHPDLLAAIEASRPFTSTAAEPRRVDPAAALCAEIAALLALEMVAAVNDQLSAVPLTPGAVADQR